MSDNNWAQKYLDELNDKLKISQNSGQQKKAEPPKHQSDAVQPKNVQINNAQSNKIQPKNVQSQTNQKNHDRFKNRKFKKDKSKGSDQNRNKGSEFKLQKNSDAGKNQSASRPVQSHVQPQATFKVKTLNGFVSSIEKSEYTVTAENKDYLCAVQESVLRQGPIYIGDRVRITLRADDRGLIDKYEPRQNYAAGPSSKGRESIQAANVNQIFLVTSVKEPVLRTDWLDTHLAVCEKRGFKPVICCSKIDLAEDNIFLEQMDVYKRMGYRIVYTSSALDSSLQEIRPMLKNKTTVFTGHTGVGKTTLFQLVTRQQKAMVPSEPEDFKFISDDDYLETQKTVVCKLEGGGFVIDTPGVREYEPGGIAPKDLKKYFRDFRNYNLQCASLECNHIDEAGCKVIDAVKNGDISEDRYQNYLRIIENITA
ncbi:ribosome small subunit-dependent GTPase A [bacterium]|nr:ribosome small subunit-dependent GTPase A [bacterium]